MSGPASKASSPSSNSAAIEPYDNIESMLDSKRFLRLESPNDGNCFYHSLEAWMRMNGRLLDGKEPTHMAIREAVADYKIAHAEEDYKSGAIDLDKYPTIAKYKAALKKMKKPNEWFSDLGDTVVDTAALVLGINIRVINWDYRSSSIDFKYTATIPGANETITLLRVGNNHYDLLMPIGKYSAEAAAVWAQIHAVRKKVAEENINELITNITKLGLNFDPKHIRNMYNTGLTTSDIKSMLFGASSSNNSNAKPAAGAGKKAASKKKSAASAPKKPAAAASRKKDKFANLRKKGITNNNIEVLRQFGMPNENMLEYNIKNLFGLLGKAAPVSPSSPNTSPNTVKPAVLRRSTRRKSPSGK